MLEFRQGLIVRYGDKKDWFNFSDVKIGKELFQMRLEEAEIPLYDYSRHGRTPRQTRRPEIAMEACLPSYLRLESREFSSSLGSSLPSRTGCRGNASPKPRACSTT